MHIPLQCVRASFILLLINILTQVSVLDPGKKMNHFKKHWSEELQKEVLESAEKIVRYLILLHIIN